jgi:hypothetical protein
MSARPNRARRGVRWLDPDTGRKYEVIGISEGKGTRKGEQLIVYCAILVTDRPAPTMCHRTVADFKRRFVPEETLG